MSANHVSFEDLGALPAGTPISIKKDMLYIENCIKAAFPSDDISNINSRAGKALYGAWKRLAITGKEVKKAAEASPTKTYTLGTIKIKFGTASNPDDPDEANRYTNFPRGCASVAALCWNKGFFKDDDRSALASAAGYKKRDKKAALIVPGLQYIREELVDAPSEQFFYDAATALDMNNEIKGDASYTQTTAMQRHTLDDISDLMRVPEKDMFEPTGIKGSARVQKTVTKLKAKTAATIQALKQSNFQQQAP